MIPHQCLNGAQSYFNPEILLRVRQDTFFKENRSSVLSRFLHTLRLQKLAKTAKLLTLIASNAIPIKN